MATKSAPAAKNSRTAAKAALLPAAAVKLDTSTEHENARQLALSNLETAEGLMGSALVNAVLTTIDHGPFSVEEIKANWPSCNSASTYASWFNRGSKAALAVGEGNARKAVEAAQAATGGREWERVMAALKSIIDAVKAQGKAKEGVDGAAATKLVKASTTAAKAAGQPKPKREPAQRGATAMDSATMAAAAAECGKVHAEMAAFLTMAARNGSRLMVPAGREEEHRKAVEALNAVAGLWADLFGRKG